ncbi:MAG: bifunctional sulfate adenylyltransferase/adenylylsulfate kinase [Desulfobacterales bacterium]|nr:bifunctional sulfate adenylyltransferase/adenylylsulfate kinase [Desulfobacterales bacterium]
MNHHQVEPYGGTLVELIVDAERGAALKELSRAFPRITLTIRQLSDLELLMNGSFSPLRGFMTRKDYEPVVDRMRLADGTLWPIPIALDVSEAEAARIEPGQTVALCDAEGFMPAVLHVEDVWRYDKKIEAEKVYGTMDTAHPGVDFLFNHKGAHYVGGTVEGIQQPLHFAYRRHRHSPAEVRALYAKLGWRRIVGFQTRHPLHRAQFEITLRAMAEAKANLLLHPVVRRVKPNDIDTYTRVRCYLEAYRRYPPNMMLLSLLPLSMRMAGPREALLHAIIRKNYGCTHFIVGQDHAGPGADNGGNPFYAPDAAAKAAVAHAGEIGIGILPFAEMVYVKEEDTYMPVSEVPENCTTDGLSREEFHRRLRAGRRIPEWYSFPEVVAELKTGYPPRHRQGFTIFCTGLSGAGKSTVAKVLYARFQEIGKRPVTLLDGDIVRLNLSSELGFSREDRDLNVRRIGFVASEITKNRGIAICAPIAPYRQTRRQIRSVIEQYGGFVEVHVNTPLEVCEGRDRKGMYAKARAGLIKGFTGVDDPYESPEQAEVSIDTTDMTPSEAAQEVLLFLEREGYIK